MANSALAQKAIITSENIGFLIAVRSCAPQTGYNGLILQCASSGLHIPLCVALHSWTETPRGAKVIIRSTIQSQSVSQEIYEYLFLSSFVGSRELESTKVEQYYRDWGILESDESIILHAQEFSK